MGEALALASVAMIFMIVMVWVFLKIGPGTVYQKVDRKRASLFATTFHCPVCGQVMEFEHGDCKAKHKFLKAHNERLTKNIKDLKGGRTW